MKRTSPAVLVVAAVIGLGAGFLANQLFTAAGRATFTPAVTLPILLLLLGAVVVTLAVPVRRASRGAATAPVNPFLALRIAMLAKASSLVGAVFAGAGGGLALFLATRPVPPSLGSMGAVLATAASGILLVAAALVAENLCTLRKDDDDDQPGGVDPRVRPDRSA